MSPGDKDVLDMDPEEYVQHLLAQAQALIAKAQEIASDHRLKFWFGPIYYDPWQSGEDCKIKIEEWSSSWSPGC